MSGFLHGLVARTLGKANVLRPRPTPRFAAVDDAFAKPPLGLVDALQVAPERHPAGEPRVTDERQVTDQRRVTNERRVPDRRAVNERPSEGLGEAISGPLQNCPVGQRLPGIVYGDGLSTPKRDDVEDGGGDRGGAPHTESFGPEYAPSMLREPNAARLPPAVSIHEALPMQRGATRAPRARSSDDVLTPDAATAQTAAPLAPQIAGPRAAASVTRPRERGSAGDLSRDGETVEDETTVVNVTIGRIEVRAPVEPPLRTIRRETQAAPQPRDQLDDYLRARSRR
jgi:hypothetical protein